MPKGPREQMVDRHARLQRIAGLRDGRSRKDSKTWIEFADQHMGPAFRSYIEGAAAGGCPIAMNLLSQWGNCKAVFK